MSLLTQQSTKIWIKLFLSFFFILVNFYSTTKKNIQNYFSLNGSLSLRSEQKCKSQFQSLILELGGDINFD